MKQMLILSKLHKRRLDTATQEVMVAYAEVERTQAIVENCRMALEKQRIDAIQQEKEMYANLCRSIVRRKRFEDVRIDLQLMKNITLEKEKAVLAAEGELEKAQAVFKQAQAKHQLCLIKCEKFNTLLDIEKKAQQLAMQVAEDAALDEVVELMYGRRR